MNSKQFEAVSAEAILDQMWKDVEAKAEDIHLVHGLLNTARDNDATLTISLQDIMPAIGLCVCAVTAEMKKRGLVREEMEKGKRVMTTETLITQLVEDLDFKTVRTWADILKVKYDMDSWLDDEYPDRMDEVRVQVADAMVKVGKL